MSDPNFDFLQAFSDAHPQNAQMQQQQQQQYRQQQFNYQQPPKIPQQSNNQLGKAPSGRNAEQSPLTFPSRGAGGGAGSKAPRRTESDAQTNQSGASSAKASAGSFSQRKSEPLVPVEELREILSRDPEAAGQFNFDALLTTSRKRLPEEERRRRRTESNRLSAERAREKRRAQQKSLELMFNSVQQENRQLREMRAREESSLEQMREIVLQNANTRFIYESHRQGQGQQ